MRILLTGGTGYLGSALLRRLLAKEHDVVLLKRRTSRTSRIEDLLGSLRTHDLGEGALERVFSENPFDIVVHCATHYGRKDRDPIETVEANQVFPLKLLQYAAEKGVRGFLNTDTILDKRVSYYSLSKRQFSEWLSLYSGRMVAINLALEHFYGPGDDTSKFVSHVVRSLLSGVEKMELTPGEQKRDFIYIDDVIDAFMTVLGAFQRLEKGFYRYEVGSGQAIRIREFVEKVGELTGNQHTELRFGALPYRENEVMESRVDLSALQRLGWLPRISLEDGLLRTIEFEKKEMRR